MTKLERGPKQREREVNDPKVAAACLERARARDARKIASTSGARFRGTYGRRILRQEPGGYFHATKGFRKVAPNRENPGR